MSKESEQNIEMNDMDTSPCKSIYIDFHGKYRRYSGLLERTPKLKSKRLKTERGKVDSSLTNNEETSNSAFVELAESYEKEVIPKTKKGGLFSTVKNNSNIITQDQNENLKQSLLKPKVRGRPRKNKEKEHEISAESSSQKNTLNSKIGISPKVKKDRTSLNDTKAKIEDFKENPLFKTPGIPKENREKLNIAFVEEKEEIPKMKHGYRKHKQRRLSGLYKADLNTGFIEEKMLYGEETCSVDEIPVTHIFEELGNSQCEESFSINITIEDSELEESDKQEDNSATPVKSKLRQRPKKNVTEEEIIKYYTDKTIKKKQTTLETIFETPKPETMSIKKYRRFISFSERMSSVKVKKRHNKIVKYNLWQNTDPITMNYFVRKIKEVEEGL